MKLDGFVLACMQSLLKHVNPTGFYRRHSDRFVAESYGNTLWLKLTDQAIHRFAYW